MISRRNLLNNMMVTAIGVAAAPAISLAGSGGSLAGSGGSLESAALQKSGRRKIAWRNWSGSQECYPDARKAPATVAELQELITSSPGRIRPVGAGHSFMPLVPTDDTIVSVSRLNGVVSHDADKMQAVVRAGTRLGDIGAPLAERGQAMINLPDIDEQSLAGALGTATHGTGASIGCLPDFVEGLKLVTANGEIINCDRENNREIFEAARVNLGALGVVTEVTLQNVPKYRLKTETTWLPIEEILENAETLADNNRNYEFYYFPFSGMGYHDVHNITHEPLTSSEAVDLNDIDPIKQARDWLSWSPKIREMVLHTAMKDVEPTVKIANSWQNLTMERNVRFNEMEYHLPREYAFQAFREVKAFVEKNLPEVFFPFEFRFIKSDDIWLSPFYGRETCSIAVHRYFKEDYKPFFDAVEPIFKKYHGRPHWGKLNTMTGPEMANQYEHWNDFKELRQQLDPNGKFLNTYLKNLFEIA